MENKILNEYKRILEERGQKPSDCVVLHFRFRGNQNSFHFEIMEKKLSGYIYDSYEDGNVFVVLGRDDSKIEKLKQRESIKWNTLIPVLEITIIGYRGIKKQRCAADGVHCHLVAIMIGLNNMHLSNLIGQISNKDGVNGSLSIQAPKFSCNFNVAAYLECIIAFKTFELHCQCRPENLMSPVGMNHFADLRKSLFVDSASLRINEPAPFAEVSDSAHSRRTEHFQTVSVC